MTIVERTVDILLKYYDAAIALAASMFVYYITAWYAAKQKDEALKRIKEAEDE